MNLEDPRIIKASFKGNPPEERKSFKKSHCLLPISVGQKVHEGQKFVATIKLVNASFKECTILVDDTVQRHTLKIDSPNENDITLYNRAKEDGSLWLRRNEAAIKLLTIPHTIKRWDDWLQHTEFHHQFCIVDALYKSDVHFKDQINQNIHEYLDRYIKREIHVNKKIAFDCCLEYLKEECAVMTLWVKAGYQFELYPSGRNSAMAITYQKLIEPFYPNLLRPVALRFKKYPSKPRYDSIVTSTKQNYFVDVI